MSTQWTPGQALAVFELVDELRDQIWRLYGLQIQAAMQKDRGLSTDPRQLPLDLKRDDDI